MRFLMHNGWLHTETRTACITCSSISMQSYPSHDEWCVQRTGAVRITAKDSSSWMQRMGWALQAESFDSNSGAHHCRGSELPDVTDGSLGHELRVRLQIRTTLGHSKSRWCKHFLAGIERSSGVGHVPGSGSELLDSTDGLGHVAGSLTPSLYYFGTLKEHVVHC